MKYNSKTKNKGIELMLKYRGGKRREIKHIEPYIPNYTNRYIEPFLDGGALFFHLNPEKAIINDINKPLMEFYNGIKYDYNQVKRELAELEGLYVTNRTDFEKRKAISPEEKVHDSNEDLYYKMRELFNNPEQTELHPATVYFYINKTAYSGMIRYNQSGEFNVPYGRYKNFNTSLIKDEHHELLKRTKVMSTDYYEVFKLAEDDDFIFMDPPYDSVFNDYGNTQMEDGFSEDMHRKLAEDFYNLSTKAMIAIGKTDLTYELYHKNIVHRYGKSYAVNIRNRFKSESNHIIVTNYDIK